MNTAFDPGTYRPRPDLLQGRVILVTGAGAGIGRAAAENYARHGATVILAGRTVAKLEEVYDSIEAQGGPTPAIIPVDLRGATLEDYRQIAENIEQQLGRLDGVLHNASVLGERKRIEDTSPASWDEVLQVNVTAGFLLTKALLPLLRASDDASLVFTSSGVGRRGRAWWGAYAVSKFATEGLMQVLADELSGTTQVRVNCINPGATNTAMRRSAYPAENPSDNPDPAAIMATWLYLMGPDSQGVNAQSLDAQQR